MKGRSMSKQLINEKNTENEFLLPWLEEPDEQVTSKGHIIFEVGEYD